MHTLGRQRLISCTCAAFRRSYQHQQPRCLSHAGLTGRRQPQPRAEAMCQAPLQDVGNLAEVMKFGSHDVLREGVFAASTSSFAFVNLKPMTPGHVLVAPMRVEARFHGLASGEVSDLWQLAHVVASCVEHMLSADSMSLVIQDGPAAGQTVQHVHIHCLPRFFQDVCSNDQIYDMIDENEEIEDAARHHRGKKLGDLDQDRVTRTPTEMAEEATRLRAGLAKWLQDHAANEST